MIDMHWHVNGKWKISQENILNKYKLIWLLSRAVISDGQMAYSHLHTRKHYLTVEVKQA